MPVPVRGRCPHLGPRMAALHRDVRSRGGERGSPGEKGCPRTSPPEVRHWPREQGEGPFSVRSPWKMKVTGERSRHLLQSGGHVPTSALQRRSSAATLTFQGVGGEGALGTSSCPGRCTVSPGEVGDTACLTLTCSLPLKGESHRGAVPRPVPVRHTRPHLGPPSRGALSHLSRLRGVRGGPSVRPPPGRSAVGRAEGSEGPFSVSPPPENGPGLAEAASSGGSLGTVRTPRTSARNTSLRPWPSAALSSRL